MSNFSEVDGFAPTDISNSPPYPLPDMERVYLVPYRWLKEAQESSVGDMEEEKGILYMATSISSYASPMQSNISTPDLLFNLRREEDFEQTENSEDEVSGSDYALISEDLWLQTLRCNPDTPLVEWVDVWKPIKNENLGIKNIKTMNLALLRWWWQRLGNGESSLLGDVLEHK